MSGVAGAPPPPGAPAAKPAEAGEEGEAIPSVWSSVIEPKPDTAEIPMVSDPFTGEVRG